jgi:hypothetical protein
MSNESSEAVVKDDTAAPIVDAVSEQQPPAKKKRGAEAQITKDDYEDGDSDDAEDDEKLKQGFKRASDEVLKKRKIYKVKRTFGAPKPAEDTKTSATTAAPTALSFIDKKATTASGSGSNPPASTTPAATTNGSSNPFASTVLASSSTEKPTEIASTPKKVFGFGSASGFGAANSGSATGKGSSVFGGAGGFAGFGSGGKSSGFGSSSSSSSSSSPGSSKAFVFGSSASGGTTKSIFGNVGASSITFSLSKKSDNSNDSSSLKEADDKATKLPEKVELKTGEEDEEEIHSGRCKSFEWVVEDNSGGAEGDSANGNKNKTNLSVKSSTQFQTAISTTSSKDHGDDTEEKDEAKVAESAIDATQEKDADTAASVSKDSGASVKYRWMELGIGPVKILRSKSNPERLRVVQRRESSKMGPATKVILNVPLWRESTCERDRQAQQYLRLKTMKEGKMCQYSLRFKENVDAGYFHHHLTDQLPLARQCFTGEAAATTEKASETK